MFSDWCGGVPNGFVFETKEGRRCTLTHLMVVTGGVDMPLFQPRTRTDASPIGVREAPFVFYDRVAGDIWDATRSLLNGWFEEIDGNKPGRIEAALKKVKTESQFQEAFWELYLHHAFLEMGFEVEFEPQVFQPDRDDHQTPDLKLTKDGREYYVEATVINDPGEEARQRDVRNLLKEHINQRLKNPNFWLAWQVVRQGTSAQIRVTELVNQLGSWLARLNVQSVETAFYQYQRVPLYEYCQNSWKILFYANPIDPSERGKPFEQILGLSMENVGGASALRDPNNIRDAIKKKGKKYDHVDAPLIIAVLVSRLGAGNQDIRAALFSGAPLNTELLTFGRIEGSFRDIDIDGVWATRKGAAYPQIAAIIAIDKHLEPAGTEEIEPVVWLNPWTKATVHHVLDWPTMVVNPTEGTIDREDAR